MEITRALNAYRTLEALGFTQADVRTSLSLADQVEVAQRSHPFELLSSEGGWWKVQDGDILHLSELTFEHRMNLVAWLQRAFPRIRLSYTAAMQIFPPQGEMACLDFERCLDEIYDSELQDMPFYRLLLASLEQKETDSCPQPL